MSLQGEVDHQYDCPSCWGTGSIESSDSTDDSWWDCRRCGGTGKLADRRRSWSSQWEWRVIQRWPNGDELAIDMDSEFKARSRQAVLDANTSHPSCHQRRVEVVRIERRQVGPWEEAHNATEKERSLE